MYYVSELIYWRIFSGSIIRISQSPSQTRSVHFLEPSGLLVSSWWLLPPVLQIRNDSSRGLDPAFGVNFGSGMPNFIFIRPQRKIHIISIFKCYIISDRKKRLISDPYPNHANNIGSNRILIPSVRPGNCPLLENSILLR
jgi:hypothetical protein